MPRFARLVVVLSIGAACAPSLPHAHVAVKATVAPPAAVTPEPAPTAVAAVAIEPAAPTPPEPAAPPAPIPPNTSVLQFGDSFSLAGFAQALRPRMRALKVRYEVRSEQSSYTTGWSAKIEQIIADTQPDLVIITLGANEVDSANPSAHAPAVRRIIQIIGDRPCVWVSPPLWHKDSGMIDVIRTNSAPCRFFDSDRLVPGPIPRQKDKIHPNEKGGALWADAFWAWLEAERLPAGPGPARPWALRPSPPGEHASAREAAEPARVE